MDKRWSIILGIGLLFAIGVFSYNNIQSPTNKQKNKVKDQVEETYQVKITEEKNCSKEKRLYYKGEKQNIYTYCIDSIKIERQGKYIELKSLEQGEDTLYHLLESLKKVEVYKDGGSILYEDIKESKQSVIPFRILQCNRIDDTNKEKNQDIYIGIKEMEYEKGFCEE